MVGIDDWAWRKGYGSYGTIIIDLERHEVLDVMQDRTADGTANWFRNHPEVEVVSRDRCGLYAKGAREDAHQAILKTVSGVLVVCKRNWRCHYDAISEHKVSRKRPDAQAPCSWSGSRFSTPFTPYAHIRASGLSRSSRLGLDIDPSGTGPSPDRRCSVAMREMTGAGI